MDKPGSWICNRSTGESEARGPHIQDQPGIHSETLCQHKNRIYRNVLKVHTYIMLWQELEPGLKFIV